MALKYLAAQPVRLPRSRILLIIIPLVYWFLWYSDLATNAIPWSYTKPQSQDEWEWARDISVVYTWVNGSDPDLATERVRHGGPAQSGLYRDHEDLRYSLRTWAAHAPWHRGKIFIVSQTAPSWLNQLHPRIQWVCQDDILPPGHQPTFSNYVVEQFLHLIPNLSDQFIYMNDDYMLNRPTQPSDFFTINRGIKFYFDRDFVSPDSTSNGGQGWSKSVEATINLLNTQYARGKAPTRYRYLKHAPYAYTKQASYGIHEKFQESLQRTAEHRFRTPGDVLWPYLHYGYVVHEGLDYEVVQDAPGKAFLLMWKTDVVKDRDAIRALDIRKPLFLAVNDDMGNDSREAVDEAHEELLRFYEERFGHLSGIFEKQQI